MTVSKETTIWCDSEDCGEWIQGPWGAVEQRRRGGYIRRDGKDYCPKCKSASKEPEDGK